MNDICNDGVGVRGWKKEMQTKGKEVQNPPKIVDVFNGWSLRWEEQVEEHDCQDGYEEQDEGGTDSEGVTVDSTGGLHTIFHHGDNKLGSFQSFFTLEPHFKIERSLC